MFYPPKSRARFYGRRTNYRNVARDVLGRRIESGDDVAAIERDLAAYLGVKHVVAMPQCRVGIYLTLRELAKTKKKVILSPYTIHDVINMVICAGCEPVFADIERATCNIDAREIAKLIGPDVGAVMVTHLHGLACDIEPIAQLCREKGVALVEDTAQSFGGRVNGKRLGSFGDAGIYSFGMAKNVNSLYGGAVATNRDDLAAKLRADIAGFPYFDTETLLRRAAFCLTGDIITWPPIFRASTFWLFRFGYLNNIEQLNKRVRGEDAPTLKESIPETYLRRMTPMQARLLAPQIPEVDTLTRVRIDYARMYDRGLAGVAEVLRPPFRDDGSHVYLNYAIQVPDRHALLRHLMRHGRDLTVQHMGNNADYACYGKYKRECPNARATASSVLLLPSYPGYGEEEVAKNIELIRAFYGAATVSREDDRPAVEAAS